jgi:hypothetical protein
LWTGVETVTGGAVTVVYLPRGEDSVVDAHFGDVRVDDMVGVVLEAAH